MQIEKLAGYSYYIENTFCGVLTCADHVTIHDPLLISINTLLDVVNLFAKCIMCHLTLGKLHR